MAGVVDEEDVVDAQDMEAELTEDDVELLILPLVLLALSLLRLLEVVTPLIAEDVEVPLLLATAEVVVVEAVEPGAKRKYAAAPPTTMIIITTAAITAPARPGLLL